MATLTKAILLNTASYSRRLNFLSLKKISTTSALSGGPYWNKDWCPGPIPKTPEERAAAAKKYGLRPEDYEILNDPKQPDQGDYPNIAVVHRELRDPYEHYDFPEDRRNYGEPIYANDSVAGSDLQDPNWRGFSTLTNNQLAVRSLLFIFAVFFTGWLTWDIRWIVPKMPKQYPFNDLYLEKGGDPSKEPEIKHYTFKVPE